MKDYKKLIIGLGIVNFLLFLWAIVIPTIRQYKYLIIIDGAKVLKLLFFSFLTFYIALLVLNIKKKKNKIIELDGKFVVGIILFCLFSFMNSIIIKYLSVDAFESKTSSIDNYLLLDKGFDNADISIFPKAISKTSQNVKYNYRYMTIDGNYWDSDLDLYLEVTLPNDEYMLEKERVKSIHNYEKIEHGYYLKSSEEYVKHYNYNGVHYKPNNEINYYFVAFFDEENKIIYNFSFGYIKPYFIRINKDNIKCESEICRIDNT